MAREPKLSRSIVERSIELRRLHQLFTQAGGRLVALQIRRQSWIVPSGQLQSFSISAAQKLVRRGLDSLFRPSMVAVGRFKVFAKQSDYMIELHLVVAGATGIKLERAFDDARSAEVRNVRRAIDNMLSGRLQIPVGPNAWKTLNAYGEELEPSCDQWPEYIDWLRKHLGRLVFRYGVDRHGNKLEKQPRQMKLKQKKRHPYPHWLEPYWFGQPWWDDYTEQPRPWRLRRGKRALENADPD